MNLRTNINDFNSGNYQKDKNLFTATKSKFQNNMYSCVIRFIPWYKNPSNSKYRKSEISIRSTFSNERIKFDCPSNDNKESIFYDLHKILRERTKIDQNDLIAKKIGEYFSRYNSYYSIIYIKENPYEPDTSNRLFVYKFGAQIDTRINALMRPPTEMTTSYSSAPANPYDLVNGRDMILTATTKTKHYSDYSTSKFVDLSTPFTFYYRGEYGKTYQHTVTNEELDKIIKGEETILSNYLVNNSPDLESYFYKEPDEKTILQAINNLKNILMPYPVILNYLLNISSDTKSVEILKSLIGNGSMNVATTPNPMSAPNPMINTPNPMATPASAPVPNPMVAPTGAPAPAPAPNPMVAPTGAPAPAPAPNPIPNPMAVPDSAPAPAPNPIPNPMAVPDSAPAPAPAPASVPTSAPAPNTVGNYNVQPDNQVNINKPVAPTQENTTTEQQLKDDAVSSFGNIINNLKVG